MTQQKNQKISHEKSSVKNRQTDVSQKDLMIKSPLEVTDGVQKLMQNPSLVEPKDVLALQKTSGNQAVTGVIQTKLKVGPVGDRYEQEADKIADQVTKPPNQSSTEQVQRQFEEEELAQMKPLAASITPVVQRQGALEEEELLQGRRSGGKNDGFTADTEIERRISQQAGRGSGISENVRKDFETQFGTDFSGVRVHTGNEADQLNKSLQARAFTKGRDIYFSSGQYQPGSQQGKRLLAHELTHVVQQTGMQQTGVQQQINPNHRSVSTIQRAEEDELPGFRKTLKAGWSRQSKKIAGGFSKAWKGTKRGLRKGALKVLLLGGNVKKAEQAVPKGKGSEDKGGSEDELDKLLQELTAPVQAGRGPAKASEDKGGGEDELDKLLQELTAPVQAGGGPAKGSEDKGGGEDELDKLLQELTAPAPASFSNPHAGVAVGAPQGAPTLAGKTGAPANPRLEAVRQNRSRFATERAKAEAEKKEKDKTGEASVAGDVKERVAVLEYRLKTLEDKIKPG